MSTPRIGELFAGYGGLGMGVQAVLGGELAWYSDVCKFDKDGNAGHYEPHRGPCRILAYRFPGVPNLGDITKVDWSQVEPVDVLTGGSPCQDLSHAGKRGGMTEGSRSNLWVAMREAIAQLRPSLVVWENVRGAYSACADSDLGRCPRCVDETYPGGHAPLLRALGRVLGDLSDLGYVGGWHGLRAADVGAPHGRMRVFVVAYPASDAGRIQHRDGSAPAYPSGVRRGAGWATGSGEAARGWASADAAGCGDAPLTGRGGANDALLPTPRATDGTKGGPNERGSFGDLMLPSAVTMLPTPQARDWKGMGPADMQRHDPNLSALPMLLPTPAVNDMGEGKTVEAWDEWTAKMQAAHGNGNGHGKSLAIEAQRTRRVQRSGCRERISTNWGQYTEAIARWEALTRPAPPPTQPSSKGNPQLSAAFSEWLMGLSAGWVTDVPGITRNEALKALGNGVVPQQAAAALRFLLNVAERTAA